ncbi:MAG: T9SS type A sorting domain-containing protein, partial [Bacteroidota bacterium]
QVQLPVASDVRVRFVFGTDSGNTETARSYAGWYIDDVQIALEPPVDENAPEILATPPLDLVHAFDAGPVPELRVEVRDDVGVQRVQALYAIEQRTRRFEGVLRLEMDPDSLNIYRGRLPFLPDTLAPGDVAFYTISVFDPSSLGASWPVGASARVQVRLIDDQDLLAEARPSGIWEATGSSWTAVLNSDAPQKSSLVLPPSPLPANAARLLLTMEHAYDLPAGATGRVMASTDAGATWAPLSTTDDIARFTGSAERAAAVFDITGRAGETLWMRLDLDVPNPGAGVWRVDGVALRQTADVDAFDTDIPFALYPAYPNPFVDSATLTYSLAEPGEVELALYDPLGRRVRMLAEGVKEAGSHVVALQAGALASGVYLARLRSGDAEAIQQVVLLK